MIDSRAKGRTAELKCRDELRKLTGLQWERTPMSGALGAQHKLKGDLYVPDTKTKYCVEVKHYKDDHLCSKILTSMNPQFFQWWEQAVREGKQIDKEPLLVFKHDRSKWFVAFQDWDMQLYIQDSGIKNILIYPEEIVVCLLTDFCKFAEFLDD